MRHFAAICSLFFTLFVAVLPAQAAPLRQFPAETEGRLFTLAGSNTLGAKLAPAWAKAYLAAKGAKNIQLVPGAAENEFFVKGQNGARGVFIDVQAHGTSTGFKLLATDKADLAMASRPVKDDERQLLQALGDLKSASSEHVTAIDGLAIIVHPSNPITQLPIDIIAKIFSGKITHWQSLGGPDLPIRLYARDNNSGTYDSFSSLVLRSGEPLSDKAARFESNDALSAQVAADRGAIGFVGLASVNTAKALAVSDNLSPAFKPEVVFVATEDYPLSRRLFLYSAETPKNAFIGEFIQFAQSHTGQSLVNKVGFVSQNPASLRMGPMSAPVPYQQLASLAERVSLNFRFQPNSAELDNKALRDLERLAQFIRDAKKTDQRIQLVGFSNSESSSKRASVLSRLRATAVKSALHRQGIMTESVMGFGATVPVANTQGQQANKNDRVEVWLVSAPHIGDLDHLKQRLAQEQQGWASSIAAGHLP